MKNVQLSNREIRLIIAGLEWRNRHNEEATSNLKLCNTEMFKSCKEELDVINKLKYKLENDVNEEQEKDESPSLIIKLGLDTTEFDNNLKKLGEKLLAISEI